MVKYILICLIVPLLVFGKSGSSQPVITVNEIPVSNEIENNKTEQFPVYNIPLDITAQKLIYNECQKYNLSEVLVYAIIKTESDFNHKLISKTGDFGLFQINKNTYPWIAKELNITNFDPLNKKHNIQAGIFYINYLRNYWQSQGLPDEEVFKLTIVSYNRGIGGCYQTISRGGIDRNKYLRRVIKNKNSLEIYHTQEPAK